MFFRRARPPGRGRWSREALSGAGIDERFGGNREENRREETNLNPCGVP